MPANAPVYPPGYAAESSGYHPDHVLPWSWLTDTYRRPQFVRIELENPFALQAKNAVSQVSPDSPPLASPWSAQEA